MKRFLPLALIIVLLFSLLTACGGGGNNGSTTGVTGTQETSNNTPGNNIDTSTSNTDNNPTPSGTSDSTGDNNTITQPTTDELSQSDNPESPNQTTPDNTPPNGSETGISGSSDNSESIEKSIIGLKLADGDDFSDGVAWVMLETRTGGGSQPHGVGYKLYPAGNWCLIDATGKILMELDDGDRPGSVFSHGAALVVRAGWNVELIDKTGAVISSPEIHDYDEILFFAHELGIIIVQKKVNTFQLTETQLGTIDSKGNWQLTLSGFERRFNSPSDLSGVNSNDRGYIGDGWQRVTVQGNQSAIMSLLTMEVHDIGGSSEPWTRVSHWENGYGVFYNSSNRGIYSVNNLTKEENLLIDGSFRDNHGEYMQGLFYFNDKADDSDEATIQGFFDINGNQVIDLSAYNIKRGESLHPGFSGDYCLLQLRNEQGGRFYTVIDKNGDFIFEPKPDFGVLKSISDEMIVLSSVTNLRIENINGVVVFETDGRFDSLPSFNNNIALIKAGSEVIYIDKNGDRLFQ